MPLATWRISLFFVHRFAFLRARFGFGSVLRRIALSAAGKLVKLWQCSSLFSRFSSSRMSISIAAWMESQECRLVPFPFGVPSGKFHSTLAWRAM
jgi:hypothetical protein